MLPLFAVTHGHVGSELVETEEEMKQFDLILRILTEDGSMDSKGRRLIFSTYSKPERQMNKAMWRTSWRHEMGKLWDSGSD